MLAGTPRIVDEIGPGGLINTSLSVTGTGSLGSPVHLVNDVALPGPFMTYSTDGFGIKGWYPMAGTQPDWLETNSLSPTFIKNHYVQQSGSANGAGNFTFTPDEANWLVITSGVNPIVNLVQATPLVQVQYNEIVIEPKSGVIVTVSSGGNISFIDLARQVVLDGDKNEILILIWDKDTSKYIQKVNTLGTYANTFANISTLLSNGQIMKDREYFITDRGDHGIKLTGVGPSTLSLYGTRIMQVPLTYAKTIISTVPWLGVWKPSNLPTAGSVCIWGGLVWVNLTGANGAPISDYSLDVTNWSVIAKNSIAASNFYIDKEFKICFDFKNDWISKQYDDQGNIIGVDFVEQINLYNFAKNPVDITDWNYETAGVIFAQNEAIGIYNNYIETIYSTSSSSYTYGVIQNNKIPGVIARNRGNISGNVNLGSITTNVCPTVSDNRSKGSIASNTVTSSLSGNWNNGDIVLNTTGYIMSNGCNGEIRSNACNKGISGNVNNGPIISNSAAVGTLAGNQNNGGISSNSIIGDIADNANNGPITGATSVVPVTIKSCYNNGSVGSLSPYVANVGSAVVNL